MECPTPEVLLAARAGSLDGATAEAVRAHVRTCLICTVSETASVEESTGPTRPVRMFDTGDDGPPQPKRPMPALPKQIGPYVVLGLLGAGGMGAVYVAYHPDLDRRVALKVLNPQAARGPQAEAKQARLFLEAQAMARLSHPNVLAVHDVGRHDGSVFIVMELVEGETLADRLQQGPLPVDEAISILRQAGSGLAAAHRAGLLHRDFKPANILLGKHGSSDARVRIADFGIARLATQESAPRTEIEEAAALTLDLASHASRTRPGHVSGTPLYMAPEQFEAGDANARADQFSFCVVAFQVLYGARPFNPALPVDVRYAALAPSQRRTEPRAFRAAILRGLSRDPRARFSSMDELLTELTREPIRIAQIAPWATLAAVVIASVATIARLSTPEPVPGCAAVDSDVAAIWGPAARERLRTAFVATGVNAATTQADTVADTLDRFARDLVDETSQACAAAIADRAGRQRTGRLVCLDQERLELKAVTDVLSQPDAAVVARGPFAAAAMAPPSRCNLPHVLERLPRNPADAALRREVDAVRNDVATALALNLAGRPDQASERLALSAARATALGFLPLVAEVASARADTAAMTGDGANGLEAARTAMRASLATGQLLLGADSLSMMAFFGAYSGKVDAAENWADEAQALLRGTGGDPLVESRVENAQALVRELRGDMDGSRVHQERAFRLREATLGPLHPRTLNFLQNVAYTYGTQCHPERAVELLEVFERAPEIARVPSIYADGNRRLAEYRLMTGDVTGAGRALAASDAAFVLGAPARTSEGLALHARLSAQLGDFKAALTAAEEAVAMARGVGEDWVNFAFSLEQLAATQLDAGAFAAAARTLTELRAVQHKSDVTESSAAQLLYSAREQVGNRRFVDALTTVAQSRAAFARMCTPPLQAAWLDLTEAHALQGLRRDPARTAALLARVDAAIAENAWGEVLRPARASLGPARR